MGKRRRKSAHIARRRRLLLAALVGLPYLLVRRDRAMPPGTHVRSMPCPLDPGGAKLLLDVTAYDASSGKRVIRHEIFDTALDMIRNAGKFVFLDMFLWNTWQSIDSPEYRPISTELADALMRKKTVDPDVSILILADPMNRMYGKSEPEFYRRLAESGASVVFTNVARLRDSNPLYSPPARLYGRLLSRLRPAQWVLRRRMVNPLFPSGPEVTVRQVVSMLELKADHRKVLITDDKRNGAWRLMVSSLNLTDGSSAHSNIGMHLTGQIAVAAMKAELKNVRWSSTVAGHVLEAVEGTWLRDVQRIETLMPAVPRPVADRRRPYAQWLTEGAIGARLLSMLKRAGQGDEIRIALFYLSDGPATQALCAAARRGAKVRIILDYNRDTFGRRKIGVPNRPMAAYLMRLGQRENLDLEIRWANTHGEQYHGKTCSITNRASAKYEITCGSANWTRRHLDDLNMEANIYVANDRDVVAMFNSYFDCAWNNRDGLSHTVAYEELAEDGMRAFMKNAFFRFQEATGLTTY